MSSLWVKSKTYKQCGAWRSMKHLNARIPPEEAVLFDEISEYCRESGYNLSQIVRLLVKRWYAAQQK